MRALSTVLASVFGNKADYFDKPMLVDIEEQNRQLTEEEKENITKQFFLKLKIMQNNFNNSNNVGDSL